MNANSELIEIANNDILEIHVFKMASIQDGFQTINM